MLTVVDKVNVRSYGSNVRQARANDVNDAIAGRFGWSSKPTTCRYYLVVMTVIDKAGCLAAESGCWLAPVVGANILVVVMLANIGWLVV